MIFKTKYFLICRLHPHNDIEIYTYKTRKQVKKKIKEILNMEDYPVKNELLKNIKEGKNTDYSIGVVLIKGKSIY